jgi:hypothetical protein
MADPFIFPTQATQVFFSDDQKKPGWKVVLRKEARSKRKVVDTADIFITITSEASGLVSNCNLLDQRTRCHAHV